MPDVKTLILLAHGSRTPAALAEMQDLAARMSGGRGDPAREPDWAIRGAFLSLTAPDLAQAVDAAVAEGSRDVRILPLFLFSGKHVLADIPEQVAALRARHPGISLTLLEPIGQHPGFGDFLFRAAGLDPADRT